MNTEIKPGRNNCIPVLRIHILIEGIVQGVGFRPYLHRLSEKHSVFGWVRNTSAGLEGELEGESGALENFLEELKNSPPPMASIDNISVGKAAPDITGSGENGPARFTGFTIRESRIRPGSTLVSPDIAVCSECEAELRDPSDRRYRYPFINCTNCGPRYTIIRSLPYDRSRTVMDQFPMCGDCAKEYDDIHNRRYHAQPDCCSRCGPRVFFTGPQPESEDGFCGRNVSCGENSLYGEDVIYDEDALRKAQQLLARGGILAVKGIGGIHLACDARSADAVNRLRRRKRRAGKPLAVMCRSLDTAKDICLISDTEEKLLTGPEHPIVLLTKRIRGSFSEVSSSVRLGVMLPYTPLHILLTDGIYGGPDLLIMTSGNQKGCPVITDNDEAVKMLKNAADGFLLHDRLIQNRCDDSLVTEWEGRPYFLRRSRGYAPKPLRIRLPGQNTSNASKAPPVIFAMGAEQKASFALGRGLEVFLSPHIGDLKNAETLAHYNTAIETYADWFHLTPSLYVCDLHPDYLSSSEASQRAEKAGASLLKVQHHWAHMASCMADNNLDETCFGIVWDGTGLGTDGTIWGGEFLIGDYGHFTRAGSIRPVSLPGGDRAVKEISRISLALLEDAGINDPSLIPLPAEKQRLIRSLLHSRLAPPASSIGRLFDGMCPLLTGRSQADYEGEGACLVEALSPVETPSELDRPLRDYAWTVHFYEDNGLRLFDTRPLVCEAVRAVKKGESPKTISLRFMASLCSMALEQCAALNPQKLPVVLSGGVFQNRFLLSGITSLLRENGFRVYTHRQVSTNDEGLCLGQLAIAHKELQRRNHHVSGNANEN